MPERNKHSEVVKAWREIWAGTLDAPALVDLYERALDALWHRAHMSLGEVTLMAIVDRVLHHGTERFPHLAVLKVETSGVQFGELRLSAPALDVGQLEESLAFLVVELRGQGRAAPLRALLAGHGRARAGDRARAEHRQEHRGGAWRHPLGGEPPGGRQHLLLHPPGGRALGGAPQLLGAGGRTAAAVGPSHAACWKVLYSPRLA